MSANNEIIIYKNKEWEIKEVDLNTGHMYSHSFNSYATLEDAIRAVEEYMKDNEVEYNYRVEL